MSLTGRQLFRMSGEELDDLFSRSPAGNAPEGEGSGAAIIGPGGFGLCSRFWAWLATFFWQGKVFDAAQESLVNRITPCSLKAIRARVYRDASWLDKKECLVLDYSRTSLVARLIRDEIREVAPGLYLGQVFVGRRRLLRFSISYQYHPAGKLWRRFLFFGGTILLLFGLYLAARFTRDEPVLYADIEEHFKYGSTGGERDAGIPLAIWRVLPKLFRDHLPGEGLASLGLIFEPDRELPIGVSRRNVQGLDRVFLNCAICHAGTVRNTPEDSGRVYLGMPSNTVDLEGFERFLFNCATDERFTPDNLLAEMERQGVQEDLTNRTILRFIGIPRMRQRLLTVRHRFLKFMDREPPCGPGRVDTFNPPKVLLNFPMGKLPREEWVGLCDFPSIWYQGLRRGMQLHWDGNNDFVEERNRSAAFGIGALPATLDRPSLRRTEEWLYNQAKPPRFPYHVNRGLTDRGLPTYQQYCARCHGRSGEDFSGELVGKVTPIEEIRTDRHRLDSYSSELAVNQNLLYAGYPEERFRRFRKTYGYANQPLDGIWLRAPYLHNGSVPTLRDLLEPAAKRPAAFYRGNDVFDPRRVGFVSDRPEERGRRFFHYATSLPGNSNCGHEGREYGTDLPAEEKDAVVELLKTF
jgi:hypothetical protein